MGYPLWKHSFIYENKTINEDLILIPLVKGNDERVSGIITASRVKQGRYEGEFIINAMSRNIALGKGKKEVDKHGRCSYLKGFSGFDQAIFSIKDNELDELVCGCEDLDNPPTISTGGDCSWSVITVCTDLDNQVSWVATTSTLPFHLDHDRDGVPNSEDQDWYEFSQRNNISQDEFEHLVGNFWNNILFELGEYSDFIFDGESWQTEQAYEEWLNDDDNNWGFPGGGPSQGSDPGGDDPDPDPEPIVGIFSRDHCGDGLLQADTRNVRCDFFYVKITGDEAGGPNWQDHYTEVILCDDCGDFIDSQGDEFRVRLRNFWRNEEIARRMDFSAFLNIVGSNGSCDALSPGFESCALGALALHDLEEYEAYGYITLTEEEKEHIMSFEPLLAVDILDFLQVNGQDPIAAQAVHDLIALQSCASGGENCVVTNYQNNLALIQTLYGELSESEFLSLMANDQVRLGIVAGVLLDNDAVGQVSELIAFINTNGLNLSSDATSLLLLHPVHRPQVTTFYENHPDDLEAEEYLNDQLSLMLADPAYREAVESMISWSPIVWAVAKEIIGDKIVDIVGDVVLGGNKQNVLDAIKAAKNSDYFGVVYAAVKLVGGNSPLGKAIKAAKATVDFTTFMVKIERIFGKFTDAAITRLWTIAKTSSIKLNPRYLEYVGDLATPRFGTGATINHLTNFDKAFPNVRVNMQVHHAYPRRAFTNYPQLGVTANQLHSLENLRGIKNTTLLPGTNTRLHTHITNKWQQEFFPNFTQNNSVPTIQHVQDFAKIIDDEFGHLFTPPIR